MAYGSPIDLDLSACTASPDGGKTNPTLATIASSVQSASAAASALEAAATTAAASAKAASDAAQTVSNSAVQKSQIGAASGVTGINDSGQVLVPDTGAGGSCQIQFGASGSSNNVLVGGYSTWLILSIGTSFFPDTSASSATLGMASKPWNGIYSASSVVVTSDANAKTVVGKLADNAYPDGAKLADALYGVDATAYKLNASIASKGAADARTHTGFIAQDIQAAITAAGLSPSDYGLWTNTPVTETKSVDSGKKDANGKPIMQVETVPVLNADGSQQYIQMLRYDEILSALHSAYKSKIDDLATRVAALEAKAAS